jgi:hypothetical protein
LVDVGWALAGVVVIVVAAVTALVFATVARRGGAKPTSIADKMIGKLR